MHNAVMKRSIAHFALVLVCALPANAETWRTYHNKRFGTTAQIPASWEPQLPGPANDDGLIFSSPDKRAKITVSGILNSLDESVQAENASFVKARDGEKITFSKLGPNWAVATGTNGENVFYRKQVMSCQDSIENHIWIEYPITDKARYDSIVNHVASTLRGGKGWQIDNCR